jgi:hypothetical protein
MPHRDVRAAIGERVTGMRKISRTTWRAGAVGLVFSGLIAGVFHNAADAAAGHGQAGHGAVSSHAGNGGILIPAKPPAATSGSSQVTSGSS